MRDNLIIDDDFYDMVHNVDLDRDTLELLFSYPDILTNKSVIDEFNLCFFSFLGNYLIYMYDSPTGMDRMKDFEYPMLQYLTVQTKNLVDFTYQCFEQKKAEFFLDKEIPRKMIRCILILLENIGDSKFQRYLSFCDPISWNIIIKIFDQVYKKEFSFMHEILPVSTKLYMKSMTKIDSKQKEHSLEEFLEILKTILSTSDQIVTIDAALNSIMDLFSNEYLDNYFLKFEFFQLLEGGSIYFENEVKKLAKEDKGESEIDLKALEVTVGNLKEFIKYKLKHLSY